MIVNRKLEKLRNTVIVHFEVLYRNMSGGTEKIVTNIRMTPVPIKIRTGSLPIKATDLNSCVNFLVGFERIIKFVRKEFLTR